MPDASRSSELIETGIATSAGIAPPHTPQDGSSDALVARVSVLTGTDWVGSSLLGLVVPDVGRLSPAVGLPGERTEGNRKDGTEGTASRPVGRHQSSRVH